MDLIYEDNLNKHVKLWRGTVKNIVVFTNRDYDKFYKGGIFIPHSDYIIVNIEHEFRQAAIGVNGRSVSVCDKPVKNFYHVEGFNYGFFYLKNHDLGCGDDIIFVPCVNVYKPNIIIPKMMNYYKVKNN